MKSFAGILATVMVVCGTVGAKTARELIPALRAIAEYTVSQVETSAVSLDWNTQPTPDVNWSIFEGFFLGLQLNSENTDHQCYSSLETMKGDVYKLPDYLRAITGQNDENSSGNTIVDALPLNSPWYQPATYFKMFKRGQELMALYFDLYE
jgi:hypothetical protein